MGLKEAAVAIGHDIVGLMLGHGSSRTVDAYQLMPQTGKFIFTQGEQKHG